jgi:hypothetical protein
MHLMDISQVNLIVCVGVVILCHGMELDFLVDITAYYSEIMEIFLDDS